ncbi:MAG: RNA-binding transcriptional accessory protein, partial [Bacteroidetes bacterium]
MNTTYISLISKQLSLPAQRVKNTVSLLDEGATIPFIARYRKEATGSLDEVQIADIQQELKRLKEIDKRRETILSTIEEQGKLTPELRKRIESSWNLTELEDIYLPYKPKRKTRASKARDLGLEPLAKAVFAQNNPDTEGLAGRFLSDEVPTTEAALQGARDIIAEWVSEHETARNRVRKAFRLDARITSKVARNKEEEGAKYRDYFEFSEPLKRCPSHRFLAIMRGESEGFLRVSIAPDEEKTLDLLFDLFLKGNNAATAQVAEAVRDSYKRLLASSIETEFRNAAKEKA